MQKIEYRGVDMSNLSLEGLNDLGAEGWEMTGIALANSLAPNLPPAMVFMRRLDDEAETVSPLLAD